MVGIIIADWILNNIELQIFTILVIISSLNMFLSQLLSTVQPPVLPDISSQLLVENLSAGSLSAIE